MKIKDILSVIVPSLYKRDLTDTVFNIKKELLESNLVSYKEADHQFKGFTFSSKEIKRLLPAFNARVKKRNGNIVTTTYFVLQNMVGMIDKITPLVERNFEDTNVSSALSYKKTQYLQFIDAMRFYVKYTRDFLYYLVSVETGQYDPGNQISNALTPAQIKAVEAGFNNFCLLTDVFGGTVGQVMNLLEAVPDVLIVPENVDMVESTLGKHKTDPFRLGLFYDAASNPFFMFQMRAALRDHARYEQAIQLRDALKLKLMYLRRKQEGGDADITLQKEINMHENLIQKLDYEITQTEKEYG